MKHDDKTETRQRKKGKIALLHLKKTAGTSAYRHLCDAAKKDKIAAWNQDLTSAKNYDIFGGHYQLRDLTDSDCNIVAFFREPIARV